MNLTDYLPAFLQFGKKEEPVREAASGGLDHDLEGFTPITQDKSRNLNPVTQGRMRKVAFKLWESNLLANRMIELPTAYLLAEGVSLQHDDEEYQNVVKRFWNDPITRMGRKLPNRVKELFIDGELFLLAFVNEINGHVRLGLLSADQVQDVIFDPDNPEQPIGVISKRDTKGNYKRYQVIINGDENVFTQRTQAIREEFNDGQCFYFNINALGVKARGRSKLLAPADHLDNYENFLFSEAERADYLRSFVWHVVVEGASQDDIINTWLPQFKNPPPAGSTKITNEKVKLNPVSPQLNTEDTEKLSRMLRNHNLGGLTIPEQLFGGGGDVNRAVGETMMEPFEKTLTMDQEIIKQMLFDIGIFQLRKHLIHMKSAVEPDFDHAIYQLKVVMPEMTAKDTTKYASALQQLTSALVILIKQKLLTEQTALQFIATVAKKLGVDFDASTELENAKENQAKAKEGDVYHEEQE